MPESESPLPERHTARGLGSVAIAVPCPTCGAPVDPLRAARVAIFRDAFRYFCSASCREQYDPERASAPLPQPQRRRGPGHFASEAAETLLAERISTPPLPDPARRSETVADSVDDGVADDAPSPAPPSESTEEGLADELDEAGLGAAESARHPLLDLNVASDVAGILLALAMLGGTLAVLLVLAGESPVALGARVIVATVGCAALVAEYVMAERDPSEAHPLALLSAPVVACLAAIFATIAAHPKCGSAIALAGLIVFSTAATVWLMQRARRGIEAERQAMALELNRSAHRVVGGELTSARATDLRPGEEIIVEASEIVPVDVTVIAGTARVAPWLSAKSLVQRSEGDAVVAGARVHEGRLRAIVSWAGHDRAWMRLTHDPRRRADLLAPLARFGKLTAERGAPIAAALAALTAFAADQDLLGIALFAVAAQAAIANAVLAEIGSVHVARTVLAALRHGIAFRTAEAFDRAGRVSTAAFCARGTLLLGEPEVANIEAIGDFEPEKVLALVAGAESGATHPVATAVLRAARARSVRPDGVRSPSVQAGLGVTAVASGGQALVVGSRALMLKERISVAHAETKINELESMGRTVLLVALGGRLVGVIGLQDGIRPGARAAVQHLLDVGVEPVLLSGDARETCEALGRALDIEHVRPELLPSERGEEIRRLVDGGATVAVVGRTHVDDAALTAADVSVALESAGSGSAEWSVQLASDDVRDAAWALRLAHLCRREARLGLTMTLGPALGFALAVAFAVAPPAMAPIASLAGSLAALLRLRARPESS
jgi:cation transport ATPase